MSIQRVAWWAVLALAHLPALAFAQSSACPGMHVQVLNIRNGSVAILHLRIFGVCSPSAIHGEW
jgi:hypothetical protein